MFFSIFVKRLESRSYNAEDEQGPNFTANECSHGGPKQTTWKTGLRPTLESEVLTINNFNSYNIIYLND